MGFKFPRRSDTVEPETTFGKSPSAGKKRSYSGGDHTHGTPHPCIVLFGGAFPASEVWETLGYLNLASMLSNSEVHVPIDKTLRLWALGLSYCDIPSQSAIRALDVATMQPLAILGYGVYYEEYVPPRTANGYTIIRLEGTQNAGGNAEVSGYMVFTIE